MESKDLYTVGDYLLKRLEQIGIRHIFGVPGDFVLKFCEQIINSPLTFINTCNELNCGYAADGYARINGIGAFTVTYGPGALSSVNSIAGSFCGAHSRYHHIRLSRYRVSPEENTLAPHPG